MTLKKIDEIVADLDENEKKRLGEMFGKDFSKRLTQGQLTLGDKILILDYQVARAMAITR
jgi:hypothetical protein